MIPCVYYADAFTRNYNAFQANGKNTFSDSYD